MYNQKAFSVLAVLVSGCASQSFTLRRTYDASNFFDGFNFRDAAYFDGLGYPGDPTDGSVNYLSRTAAEDAGLVYFDNDQIYIGVDYQNVAQPLGRGTDRHARDSVRLESKETFNTGLVIADIAHMPGTACGVWPSLWSYNFDEDPVGEIDIIEGVNNQNQNVVSLHTCGTCTFSNIGGQDERPDCNNGGTESMQCEDGTQYDGCGNTHNPGSYGDEFNDAEGGVYVLWLATDALNIYWWNRSNIPSDITNGSPNPSLWGTPASRFVSGSGCSVAKYFKDQTLIINTDFCGSNIDSDIWNDQCSETGADTCDDYITNNPADFAGAYWLFNSIKIYQ